MTELVEIGKISARGQIAIPMDIRRGMNLHEGERILFILEDDTLLMRKVTSNTFAAITKPLKEAARKAGMKESDVPELVQRFREKKRR